MDAQSKIQLIENADCSNQLFIKRDDLLPFSFGGNKSRKVKLFFEDIKKRNADYVITYGSGSSNHCRVVANASAANDLPCLIISPEDAAQSSINSCLMRLFGAKIITCPLNQVSSTIEEHIECLKRQDYNPYFIPGGGHGNIGTQAFVECFDEILSYENMYGISFDYIFLASGTGTTQAGLICGKLMHGSRIKIVGISIARKNPYGCDVVRKSVSDYLNGLGLDIKHNDHIEFVDDYIAGGYGLYNEQILQTVRNVMTRYGIPLNTTYTGKAFWGMHEYILRNDIKNKKILFLHTGGVPLFFDDLVKMGC